MSSSPLNKLQNSLSALWRHGISQIKRYSSFADLYRKAMESSPDHAMAYVHWGVQLAQLGEIPDAEDKFAKAAELSPNRPEAWINWGVALAKQGALDEAIDKFKRASELAPNLAANYVLWGAALLEKGEAKEAENYYEKAVSLDDGNHETFANWGIALARAGRYQEASARFKHAIGLHPHQAQIYFLWGAVLAEMEQYEEAIKKFEATLRLRPKQADALYFWAVALNRLGRYNEAVEKSKQALSLTPDNPELYLNLGDALANLNQLDVAMANYRQALALNPRSADAFVSLGLTLCKLDKHTEGWAMFERAKALEPDHPELARCWGGSLVERGEYQTAIPLLQEAVSFHPNDSAILLNLSFALMKLGQTEASLAALDKVKGLDEDQADRHFMLGTYYLNLGKRQEAKNHLERALRSEANHPGAAFNRALLLAESGEGEEAVRLLRPLYRDITRNQSLPKINIAVLYSLLLAWTGDWWEAKAKLEQLHQQHPKNLRVLLALLDVAIKAKQPDVAYTYWQALQQLQLNHANAQDQWLGQWLGAKLYELRGGREPVHLEKIPAMLEQCLRLNANVGQAWQAWFTKALKHPTSPVELIDPISFRTQWQSFIRGLWLNEKAEANALAALAWGWQATVETLSPTQQEQAATILEDLKAHEQWPVAEGLAAEEGSSPTLLWACGF